MSEETDKRLLMAVIELEHATEDFVKMTSVPLRGYTIRQPYARAIRARSPEILKKIREEFQELLICCEPDSK